VLDPAAGSALVEAKTKISDPNWSKASLRSFILMLEAVLAGLPVYKAVEDLSNIGLSRAILASIQRRE
jgi:hypothetical protein